MMRTDQLMKDFGFSANLFFKLCKGIPDINSVKPLAHLLAREGFHPSPATGGEKLYVAPDIDTLVEARFDNLKAKGKSPGGLLYSLAFPLLMNEFPEDKVKCYFDWSVYKGERTWVTMGGTALVFQEEQKKYQESFAQRLLEIGQKLYPLTQPIYGYLGDFDLDPDPWEDKRILKREIVNLSWVNFFGPEYVAKYGREILAAIPGYRVQDLPGGGLLYQSRPSIVVEDMRSYKHWRRQVSEYLVSYGIQSHWRPRFRA